MHYNNVSAVILLVKYLNFSSLFCQQESRALMTFAVDSQKRRVMMSSTKGSFSVQEVRKSKCWPCSAAHLLLRKI